jgi:hypothetical protein
MDNLEFLTEIVDAVEERLTMLQKAVEGARDGVDSDNTDMVLGCLLMAQMHLAPLTTLTDAGILVGKRPRTS